MFCRNCQTIIPDDSLFCENCGAPTGLDPGSIDDSNLIPEEAVDYEIVEDEEPVRTTSVPVDSVWWTPSEEDGPIDVEAEEVPDLANLGEPGYVPEEELAGQEPSEGPSEGSIEEPSEEPSDEPAERDETERDTPRKKLASVFGKFFGDSSEETLPSEDSSQTKEPSEAEESLEPEEPEETIAEEPVAEEHAAEEFATEEFVAEEFVAKESIAKESIAEEPVAEEKRRGLDTEELKAKARDAAEAAKPYAEKAKVWLAGLGKTVHTGTGKAMEAAKEQFQQRKEGYDERKEQREQEKEQERKEKRLEWEKKELEQLRKEKKEQEELDRQLTEELRAGETFVQEPGFWYSNGVPEEMPEPTIAFAPAVKAGDKKNTEEDAKDSEGAGVAENAAEAFTEDADSTAEQVAFTEEADSTAEQVAFNEDADNIAEQAAKADTGEAEDEASIAEQLARIDADKEETEETDVAAEIAALQSEGEAAKEGKAPSVTLYDDAVDPLPEEVIEDKLADTGKFDWSRGTLEAAVEAEAAALKAGADPDEAAEAAEAAAAAAAAKAAAIEAAAAAIREKEAAETAAAAEAYAAKIKESESDIDDEFAGAIGDAGSTGDTDNIDNAGGTGNAGSTGNTGKTGGTDGIGDIEDTAGDETNTVDAAADAVNIAPDAASVIDEPFPIPEPIPDEPVLYRIKDLDGREGDPRREKFGPVKKKRSFDVKRLFTRRNVTLMIIIAVIIAAIIGVAAYMVHQAHVREMEEAAYQASLKQAHQLVDAEKYKKAEKAYLALIDQRPEDPAPYLGLADMYIEQQRYVDAKALIKRAEKATGNKEAFQEVKKDLKVLTSNKWKKEYIKVLEDNEDDIRKYEDDVAASVAVCDVNGDLKPELFFFTEEYYGYGKLHIYTTIDNKAKEVNYECKNRGTQYQDAFYDVSSSESSYAIFNSRKNGQFSIYANVDKSGETWDTTNQYKLNMQGGCKQIGVLEGTIDSDNSEYELNGEDIGYDKYVADFKAMLDEAQQVILYNGNGGDQSVWDKVKPENVMCMSYDALMTDLKAK